MKIERLHKVVCWICGAYVGVLVILLLASLFLPSYDPDALCYWKRGEMIPYVQCEGRWGRYMSFLFNAPASLFWAPALGLSILFFSPNDFLLAAYSLGVAAMFWSPIAYLVWYRWKLRKRTRNGAT